MERRSETLKLVLGAVFIALVALATMVIQIPIPQGGGYLNIGDTMIFVAALLLGPVGGAVAGGLGSALADVLNPVYAYWAPWTLVVKGIEGLLVGLLGYGIYQRYKKVTWRVYMSMAVGALWMVIGYYLASSILYSFAAAWAFVPMNMIQGAVSVVLAGLILGLLRHLKT